MPWPAATKNLPLRDAFNLRTDGRWDTSCDMASIDDRCVLADGGLPIRPVTRAAPSATTASAPRRCAGPCGACALICAIRAWSLPNISPLLVLWSPIATWPIRTRRGNVEATKTPMGHFDSTGLARWASARSSARHCSRSNNGVTTDHARRRDSKRLSKSSPRNHSTPLRIKVQAALAVAGSDNQAGSYRSSARRTGAKLRRCSAQGPCACSAARCAGVG